MKIIISQQGSGSRILSAYLFGEVSPEPFAKEPADKPGDVNNEHIRLMYRHLEAENLWNFIKDKEIIHLYRDPARTFLRDVAKYNLTVTKADLKKHIDYVSDMRDRVNQHCKNVTIVHYEDFIRELYLGDIKEFNHL